MVWELMGGQRWGGMRFDGGGVGGVEEGRRSEGGGRWFRWLHDKGFGLWGKLLMRLFR